MGIGDLCYFLVEGISGLIVVCFQFGQQCIVIFDVNDGGGEIVVFCRCMDYCRVVDVDVFDYFGIICIVGQCGFEWVQVYN